MVEAERKLIVALKNVLFFAKYNVLFEGLVIFLLHPYFLLPFTPFVVKFSHRSKANTPGKPVQLTSVLLKLQGQQDMT